MSREMPFNYTKFYLSARDIFISSEEPHHMSCNFRNHEQFQSKTWLTISVEKFCPKPKLKEQAIMEYHLESASEGVKIRLS